MIIWQIRRLAKNSEPCMFSLRVNTRCTNCVPTLDSCYLALFLNRGCMEIYVFLLQLKVTSSTNHGVTLHIGKDVIMLTANNARRARQSSREKKLFVSKQDRSCSMPLAHWNKSTNEKEKVTAISFFALRQTLLCFQWTIPPHYERYDLSPSWSLLLSVLFKIYKAVFKLLHPHKCALHSKSG